MWPTHGYYWELYGVLKLAPTLHKWDNIRGIFNLVLKHSVYTFFAQFTDWFYTVYKSMYEQHCDLKINLQNINIIFFSKYVVLIYQTIGTLLMLWLNAYCSYFFWTQEVISVAQWKFVNILIHCGKLWSMLLVKHEIAQYKCTITATYERVEIQFNNK